MGERKRRIKILSGEQRGIPRVTHTDTKCWRRCTATVQEDRGTCTEGECEAVEKPQGTSLWVSAQTAVSRFISPLCALAFATVSGFWRGWRRMADTSVCIWVKPCSVQTKAVMTELLMGPGFLPWCCRVFLSFGCHRGQDVWTRGSPRATNLWRLSECSEKGQSSSCSYTSC